MDVVTDLQLSADRSYFITSSKDKTARIHDTKTLTVLQDVPDRDAVEQRRARTEYAIRAWLCILYKVF